MEIRKLLVVGLATAMVIAVATPVTISVVKAASDTVSVTFDPQGTITIDISPTSWAAGTLAASASTNTTPTYFTVYNNGTVQWGTLYIQAASSASMTVVDASPGANQFAMQVNGTGTDITTWTGIATNRTLETAVDPGTTETFGLKIIMGSSFTDDWGSQTSVVTLTAVD